MTNKSPCISEKQELLDELSVKPGKIQSLQSNFSKLTGSLVLLAWLWSGSLINAWELNSSTQINNSEKDLKDLVWSNKFETIYLRNSKWDIIWSLNEAKISDYKSDFKDFKKINTPDWSYFTAVKIYDEKWRSFFASKNAFLIDKNLIKTKIVKMSEPTKKPLQETEKTATNILENKNLVWIKSSQIVTKSESKVAEIIEEKRKPNSFETIILEWEILKINWFSVIDPRKWLEKSYIVPVLKPIKTDKINLKVDKIEYYNKYIDELITELEITNPLISSKVKYNVNRILKSENQYETLRQLFNQNDILVDLNFVNSFNFLIKDYIYKFTYKLKLQSDEKDVNNEIDRFNKNKDKKNIDETKEIIDKNIKIISPILNEKIEEAWYIIFAKNPEIFNDLLIELKEKKVKTSQFYKYISQNWKYKNYIKEFENLEKFRKDLVKIIYLCYFTKDSKEFSKKYIDILKAKNIVPNISKYDNKKDDNINSIENLANTMLLILKKENNINVLDSIKDEKVKKELEIFISLKIVKIAKNISRETEIPFSEIIKEYLTKKWYLNKNFINNEEEFIKNKFYVSKKTDLEEKNTLKWVIETVKNKIKYWDLSHTISIYYWLE